MFLLKTASRGLGFVRNVVLARILAPDDFGLFGVALVVLSFVERFSATGLQSALVQKKEDIADYLDSAWTVQALRGAVVAVLLVASAPFLAAFFGDARAEPLIQVLGVSFLLGGLTNIGTVEFHRELEMNRQFGYQLSGTLADLAVSIVLSFVLGNVWALMLGMIAGRVVSLVASYALHPYRPKPRLDWGQVRELRRYGRWVFLHHILYFLSYRGDNLIVGKFLGAPALGIYMLAYSISEVVTGEVGKMLDSVAFPVYARAQGNVAQVRAAFLIATELVAAVSLPVAVALYFLAAPVTDLLLGQKWTDVAAVLPALALAGALGAIASNGVALFRGLGRPDIGFRMNLLGVAVTYAIMFPLMLRYGITGVGVAVAAGMLACLPLLAYGSRAVLDTSFRELAAAWAPSAALSAAVALPLFLLPNKSPAAFVLVVLAAVASYGGMAMVLWMTGRRGPLRIIHIARLRRAT